ncbi:MAG: hypothetical protein E3J72_19015 [Planctomycetota bacterium]|nr:MAG: hypothetical protein E3J72_19015 [Planctomycetota bacterium]
MKNLPLKLGIGVCIFFMLLITGMILWKPLNILRYATLFHSKDRKEKCAGVDGLILLGKAGKKELAMICNGGMKEADFIIEYWKNVNVEIDKRNIAILLMEEYQKNSSQINLKEFTPLHLAVMHDYITAVELLIAKGAEVNSNAFILYGNG